MTNPRAANEPADANQPADRDTAADTEPRFEADFGTATDRPTVELPDESQPLEDAVPPAPLPEQPTSGYPHPEQPTSGYLPPPEDAPTSGYLPPPGAAPPPGPFPPPSAFPPPGGYPPPGAFPPPGPTLNRPNLVRPRNGKYIAGVCAAIARATNTDPALWRVLFAVLTLAGGIGMLGYLLGWLLIPAEGDSGSPLEAMFGRGKSNTSGPMVILVAVMAVVTFVFVVSDNVGPAVIGLGVVIGTVALLLRGNTHGDRQPAPPPTYPGYPGYPTQPPTPEQTAQFGAPPQAVPTPTMPMSTSAPPVTPAPTMPSPTSPSTLGMPVVPPFAPTPPLPAPTGFRPPFAPHGPYASSSPYAASLGYSATGPVSPYPGLNPTPAVPKPPRQRSKLGRLTLSVMCLALGGLAVLNLGAGAAIDADVFAATALTVLGLGLVLGAWLGRARWLIPIGVVATMVLAGTTATLHDDHVQRTGDLTVTPFDVNDIEKSYRTDVGNINLDLSRVDFLASAKATGGGPIFVDVGTRIGNIDITLPANVDAIVSVDVQGGDLVLFDRHSSGLNQHQEVTNEGSDGPGGGEIHIFANVNLGNVEVHR